MPEDLRVNYDLIFSIISEQAKVLSAIDRLGAGMPRNMAELAAIHPMFGSKTILASRGRQIRAITYSSKEYPLIDKDGIAVEFEQLDSDRAAEMLGKTHFTLHPERVPAYAFGLRVSGASEYFSVISFDHFDSLDRPFKRDLITIAGLDPERMLKVTKLYDVENCPIFAASTLFNLAVARLRRRYPELQGILTYSNPNFFTHKIQRALGHVAIGAKSTRTRFRQVAMADGKRFAAYTTTRRLLEMSCDFEIGRLPLLPTFICLSPIGPWREVIANFTSQGYIYYTEQL